jgi:hypothetical protein
MRTASTRAEERGVGLRSQKSPRNFLESEFSELWLDSPNVAILIEPSDGPEIFLSSPNLPKAVH